MRAILVKEFGDAEVMQVGEVRVPEPGRDEILVRILAAGMGPWDVEQRRGGWSGPLPYIPGREFAGLVVGGSVSARHCQRGESFGRHAVTPATLGWA
jgi:NADPH:quinone reductase-like Zn-dependent oxidoreductase